MIDRVVLFHNWSSDPMYAVREFIENDESVLRSYIADHPFATLVITTPEGPSVEHLPMEFQTSEEGAGRLLGHIARANPMWRAFESGQCLAVFSGHDAPVEYIERLVEAVVGVELRVERMVGKWKLGQDRSAEDREGVIAGLRREGGAGEAAVADLMERRES